MVGDREMNIKNRVLRFLSRFSFFRGFFLKRWLKTMRKHRDVIAMDEAGLWAEGNIHVEYKKQDGV